MRGYTVVEFRPPRSSQPRNAAFLPRQPVLRRGLDWTSEWNSFWGQTSISSQSQVPEKNGEKVAQKADWMAVGGGNGLCLGRGRPLDHHLCLRCHLVHRSRPFDLSFEVQKGRVYHQKSSLPYRDFQLFLDFLSIGMYARGLQMLANTGMAFMAFIISETFSIFKFIVGKFGTRSQKSFSCLFSTIIFDFSLAKVIASLESL